MAQLCAAGVGTETTRRDGPDQSQARVSRADVLNISPSVYG